MKKNEVIKDWKVAQYEHRLKKEDLVYIQYGQDADRLGYWYEKLYTINEVNDEYATSGDTKFPILYKEKFMPLGKNGISPSLIKNIKIFTK